jgi:hypothetical protein
MSDSVRNWADREATSGDRTWSHLVYRTSAAPLSLLVATSRPKRGNDEFSPQRVQKGSLGLSNSQLTGYFRAIAGSYTVDDGQFVYTATD